jgi:hypothetical protein
MRRLALALALGFSVASGASATPVITNGLVAGYEFNGNADDVSGNGNHGVVNGATLTADRFGNADSAYSFDGVDDYIGLGDQDFGAALSISLWVNFHQITAAPQLLINKYDGDSGAGDVSIDRTFDLYMHQEGEGRHHEFFWTVSQDGVNYSDERSITRGSAGEWYHLVATFDNGAASIYVNNAQEVSWATGYSTLYTSDVELLLGRQTKDHPVLNDQNVLDGTLDDVYIYNRALSPAEVSTLYSAVPEPTTGLLLGLGLLGVAVRRRV